MYKKLIVIIPVVLAIIILALAGYYFITQSNNPTSTNPVVTTFRKFFPLGGNNTQITEPTTNNNNQNQNPQVEPVPQKNFTQKLRLLSSEPTSGAGTLDVKAGTVVRYIEKATGHIFEIELFSPNQNRISNTTIPLVYEGIWGNKNASLIARYLKDDNQTVDTFSLIIKDLATSTENTISGIAFPANIADVSVLGSDVFYLQENSDSSFGFISSFDGIKKKQIWNSPIKELLSQFVSPKIVALTTKPDQNLPGFLYFVDTGSGQVKRVLGDILGLSALVNGDGTAVLYLEEGGASELSVFNIKNNSSQKISPITFPEKCAWSRKDKNVIYCAVPREYIGGNSLTSWYKGFVSLTDDVWKYDIKNNTSSTIENLSLKSGTIIDVIKPILSENEQYLLFINKIDNSLWSLDLVK